MGKAGGTVKGRRARPRKWAQQVVAGRAGMRRDDESVTHGVAPRMLILPPQTLPPLFTWMSHIPSRHISYRSVLSIFSLSSRLDQPFDNLFDLLSRGEESRGRREHVDRYGSRDIRVDGSDFRGTTFRRNERNNTSASYSARNESVPSKNFIHSIPFPAFSFFKPKFRSLRSDDSRIPRGRPHSQDRSLPRIENLYPPPSRSMFYLPLPRSRSKIYFRRVFEGRGSCNFAEGAEEFLLRTEKPIPDSWPLH